eukprot:gene4092-4339_t
MHELMTFPRVISVRLCAQQFKPPRLSNSPVMLASDDHAELYHRCRVVALSEGYVELKYIDIQHAWTVDRDAVTWRPNSRLPQAHQEAVAGQGAVPDPVHRPKHQQQQQQQRLPSSDDPVPQQLGSQLRSPSCLKTDSPEQELDAVGGSGAAAGSSSAEAGRAAAGAARSSLVEKSLAAGVHRVPVGQIGAGLPVVVGGAAEDDFLAALHKLWRDRLGGGYPRRMPACSLMAGQVVEPWHLWREVWSWGGPHIVSQYKLWATVGFSFHPPASCTSVSNRIRRSYEAVIAPLDEAISRGKVKLARPQCSRQPKHRNLQEAVSHQEDVELVLLVDPLALVCCLCWVPQMRPPPVPGATGAGCGVRRKRPSSPSEAAAEATHPASSAGGSTLARPRSRGAGGGAVKRKRSVAWQVEEDEAAPDVGSDYEDPDDATLDDALAGDGDSKGTGQQHPISPAKQGASSRPHPGPPGGSAKAPADPVRVRLSDQMVVARVRLTPAAADMQASLVVVIGSSVDFRTMNQEARCANGWRPGTVLDIHPGSEWEGGRRLLVQPRHTHHTHGSSSQAAQQHEPATPAATAALAALAAVGCSAATEGSAQKLLTPGGHLRHELAALMPSHGPGSPSAVRIAARSASGAGPAQFQIDEGEATAAAKLRPPNTSDVAAATTKAGDHDRPVWVPLLWRGPASRPFSHPVVMVRPLYAPQGAGEVVAAGIKAAGDGAADDDGADGGGRILVLQNMAPPESDQSVWRCSAGHAMRPAHPLYNQSYGVLYKPSREDFLQHQYLRKAMSPYTYAGGLQTFGCLHHMCMNAGMCQ